jgi:hypothetical protein
MRPGMISLKNNSIHVSRAALIEHVELAQQCCDSRFQKTN